MKKYIALIALLAVTGCGGSNEGTELTTVETSTEYEYTTEAENNGEYDNTETETVQSDETEEAVTENNQENGKQTEGFEKSQTYSSLENLASNAGFDISYGDNTVTFKAYITDDTIDCIKEKDSQYHSKWNENCGLYEEFCFEALRTIKNDNVTDVNIELEVVGSSDNQVYYENENGSCVYDAYRN